VQYQKRQHFVTGRVSPRLPVSTRAVVKPTGNDRFPADQLAPSPQHSEHELLARRPGAWGDTAIPGAAHRSAHGRVVRESFPLNSRTRLIDVEVHMLPIVLGVSPFPADVEFLGHGGSPFLLVNPRRVARWFRSKTGADEPRILLKRTSENTQKAKFTSRILHSPGLIQQSVLCRASKVHSPTYIRH